MKCGAFGVKNCGKYYFWITLNRIELNKKVGFIVLAMLVLITVVLKILFYPSFDSDDWKNNPDNRSKYVNSLVNSGLVEGKDYGEVIDILGEPNIIRTENYNGTNLNKYNQSNTILEYLTGGVKYVDFERIQVQIIDNKAKSVTVYYD